MTELSKMVLEFLDKYADNFKSSSDDYDRLETDNYAFRWVLNNSENLDQLNDYIKYYDNLKVASERKVK